MTRKRNWMHIFVREQSFALSPEYNTRAINQEDSEALGKLMDLSYKDTIDWEGETLEQCTKEMHDTLIGKYGPLISQASFLIIYENQIVSAILITEWKGVPLIAYTMTDKKFLGRGLAKHLLGKSISALSKLKWKELFLVVTEGNTSAEKLYRKVGFKLVAQALPGAPPPQNL